MLGLGLGGRRPRVKRFGEPAFGAEAAEGPGHRTISTISALVPLLQRAGVRITARGLVRPGDLLIRPELGGRMIRHLVTLGGVTRCMVGH
ncbi:hypothetical protein MNVM_12950 [Mycobacterium novum]|uniref:Uncharacterized protein n=1 Tax=Mycobacterium novum TaxID=2492438 RepID=A0A7I7JLT7_9MYCO|nr:hypothetical protein MNVM_12950 [Mycobacterium novum]